MEVKYNSHIGSIISRQEFEQGVAKHEKHHGNDEDYTQYEVFGVDFLNELKPEGTVAFRVYNVIGEDQQTGIFIIPVNQYGEQLTVFQGGLKDDGDVGGGKGRKCPTQCG